MPALSHSIEMAIHCLNEIIRETKTRKAITRRCLLSHVNSTDKIFWSEVEKINDAERAIKSMETTINELKYLQVNTAVIA